MEFFLVKSNWTIKTNRLSKRVPLIPLGSKSILQRLVCKTPVGDFGRKDEYIGDAPVGGILWA